MLSIQTSSFLIHSDVPAETSCSFMIGEKCPLGKCIQPTTVTFYSNSHIRTDYWGLQVVVSTNYHMKIKQILTNRSFSNGKDYRIVNEWEDMLSQLLDVPLYYDDWKRRDKTIFWKFPLLASFFQTSIPTFAYVMLPIASPHGNNK